MIAPLAVALLTAGLLLGPEAAPAAPSGAPAAVAPAAPAAEFTCEAEGPGELPRGTVPGALRAPYPTQRGISLDWAIDGDSDLDGDVAVRYRRRGATAWTTALPLRRVPAGSNEGFSWANRHSGSILDTAPGTTYDVQVRLDDPDGGCAVRALTVRTPRVPAPAADARVRRARPPTLESVLAAARPGDVVELRAGTYSGFSVPVDGTAQEPVVVRSRGRVVVNGEIGLYDRRFVQVRGLVVHGRIRANGSTGIAVVGNTISGSPDGGIQVALDSKRAYLAENSVIGPTPWRNASVGADGDNTGEGILVTGPGHVIERNTVRGWRDCVSTLEDGEAIDQLSLDIRANDLRACADDAIEADFCFHNCRVSENRILNSFVAMSSQPGLGGPTYFVRNTAYNILYAPFKLHRGSVGDVLLHNTTVKHGDALNVYSGVTHARQYARNNVFLGGPGGTYGGYSGGTGLVMSLDYAAADVDLDYDGYGTTARGFRGTYRGVDFSGLARLRSTTTERHGVKVGFGIFARPLAYPDRPFREYPAQDLRLRSGSAAVDAGLSLPGLSGDDVGRPDLGAVEAGGRPSAVGVPPGVSLAIADGSDPTAPHTFRARGRLVLPAGIPFAPGCRGRVTVTAYDGATALGTELVRLVRRDGRCEYAATLVVADARGASAAEVRAAFAGNLEVSGASSPRRGVVLAR